MNTILNTNLKVEPHELVTQQDFFFLIKKLDNLLKALFRQYRRIKNCSMQ